ncbi:hypothetical protein KC722_02395 [Candidatus Kaiserbacteria bacterium]|nr:hypothetical protein [Candidatus Kaiserbacteria bacterium]
MRKTSDLRVAMLVLNSCNPDARVRKEAEALAALGHNVRVYCLHEKKLPDKESLNGVDYIRVPLAMGFLIGALMKVLKALKMN